MVLHNAPALALTFFPKSVTVIVSAEKKQPMSGIAANHHETENGLLKIVDSVS